MKHFILAIDLVPIFSAEVMADDVGKILSGVADIINSSINGGTGNNNGGGAPPPPSWSTGGRPANTTGRWFIRNGHKYWQTTWDHDIWIDAQGHTTHRYSGGGGVSVSPLPGSSSSSYHHPSQAGVRWYKNDSIRWTKGSSISHMPYRYYINGKYYAMRRQDFVNYFHMEPPAMVGNGFYPVDRVGVVTTNQWKQRYEASAVAPVPAPLPSSDRPTVFPRKDDGGLESLSKEELIKLLKKLSD